MYLKEDPTLHYLDFRICSHSGGGSYPSSYPFYLVRVIDLHCLAMNLTIPWDQ